MIKCLIIDDDKFERDGLRYMINRMELPVEITDVRNGSLGLDRLSKENFDMVITDIKMPVMDGMTFLEKAKVLRPDSVYIIYSGYNDFLYAKKAISLQVMDFLVKPVSDEEFEKVMQRTMSVIQEKRKQKVRYMLECLRVGNGCTEFADAGGRLVLLKAGDGFREQYGFLEEKVSLLAIRDNHYMGYVSGDIRKQGIAWEEYDIEGGFISEPVGSFRELEEALERLRAMLAECIFSKKEKIAPEREYRRAKRFVCSDKNKWFLEAGEYLEHCHFLSKDMLQDMTKSMPENMEALATKMERAGSPEELSEIISCYQDKGQDNVVSEVQYYIKKNYFKELSIEELARVVYLTPAYLCTVFKKQTGTTLINYLTDYRMEKATELLKNHELKTSDVAKMVGYNNVSYFNMVFKTKTGKTPGQFRKEQNH